MNQLELHLRRLGRDKKHIALQMENSAIRKEEIVFDRSKIEDEILYERGRLEIIRHRKNHEVEADSLDYYRAERDEAERELEIAKREFRLRELTQDLDKLDKELSSREQKSLEIDDRIALIEEESKSLLAFAKDGEEWPVAVQDAQIVKTDEDKMDRAGSILLDLIEEDLTGKTFLDFGCGEGWVVKEASDTAALAVGYDLKEEGEVLPWGEESENAYLTTSFDDLKAKGPFDVIVLYDVLDHSEQDPADVMSQVRELSGPNTKIYLRLHPWTSRHGGHLYTKLNRAFLHLVLTEEELSKLDLKAEHHHRTTNPIATYRYWLRGFKIEDEFIHRSNLEPFFVNDSPARKRMNLFARANDDVYQISFVDYILTLG